MEDFRDIYSNIFWTLQDGLGFPAVRWTFAEMKLRRGPWEAWNLHDFRDASSSPGDVAQLLPQGTLYPTTFVTSKIRYIQFFIHFEGGHVTRGVYKSSSLAALARLRALGALARLGGKVEGLVAVDEPIQLVTYVTVVGCHTWLLALRHKALEALGCLNWKLY